MPNRYAVFPPPLIVGTRATNVVKAEAADADPDWQLLAPGTYCEPGAEWDGVAWFRPAPTVAESEERGVFVGGVYIANTPAVRDRLLLASIAVVAGDGASILPFTVLLTDGTLGTITTGAQLRAVMVAFWKKS